MKLTFDKTFKEIIAESKEIVNGENKKKNIIQEDPITDISEEILIEPEFLNKLIEYIELNYLNESSELIFKEFKKFFKNNKDASNILNKHKQENTNHLIELKNELKKIRKQIQGEIETTPNKISLITILDKSLK